MQGFVCPSRGSREREEEDAELNTQEEKEKGEVGLDEEGPLYHWTK